MRLGLVDRPIGKVISLYDKVIQHPLKRTLKVADIETGEEVENVLGMIWGPASVLTEGSEPLFPSDHFNSPTQEVVVVVFECEHAKEVKQ